MIFVDTNIFIDLAQANGEWTRWSENSFSTARAADELVTNLIVLAELAPGFDSADLLENHVQALGVGLVPLTPRASFRAGQAHLAYRRAGGARPGILADFLIGGHASVLDAKLLTRDRRRFARYFPELEIIAPETDHG